MTKEIIAKRIQQLQQIAAKHGVEASIKPLSGQIYAHINGQSFRVKSEQHFEQECIALKNCQSPSPIDLTNRLARIEETFVNSLR